MAVPAEPTDTRATVDRQALFVFERNKSGEKETKEGEKLSWHEAAVSISNKEAKEITW